MTPLAPLARPSRLCRLTVTATGAALWLPALGAGVPTIYNADIARGTAAFDASVAAAGAVLRTQRLWFLRDGDRQFSFNDFSIRSSDGGPRLVDDDYAALREHGHPGALSGWALGLVPNRPVTGSGLTFSFREPVNAFGLEIGDWATCCFPSSLYIAFDGGATRLVATARTAQDNPGVPVHGQHTSFVGAIDTGGSFTTVTMYGDGVGEYLVAGGTIRYAGLPVATVPEPNPAVLLAAGLLALGFLSQRRRGLAQARLRTGARV